MVVSRAKLAALPGIALVGAGNLATALGGALRAAGYPIAEVLARDHIRSLARARRLARSLGAVARPLLSARLDAAVVWICVSDDALAEVAAAMAAGRDLHGKVALHTSGAWPASVLQPLQAAGASIASAHPIMTFTAGALPTLKGVWFGLEGDAPAVRTARTVIRRLGATPLRVSHGKKALYHAWGSMASPLVVALLAAAEEVARHAGIPTAEAREAILPLLRQTIENYSNHGAPRAFSGPLRRGDVATVARHLEALRSLPRAQEIYVALARSALHTLPVEQRERLRRLLGDTDHG